MRSKRRGIPTDGKLIRELRLARGWSQDEAASRARVSTKLFRKAECGLAVDAESICLLASLFSTPERIVSSHDLVRTDATDLLSPLNSSGQALLDTWFGRIWGEGDWNALIEIVAPQIQFHCRSGLLINCNQLKDEIAAVRASFRDFEARLESSSQVGSVVVTRWQMRMRHSGQWLGQRPTENWLEVIGTTTLRTESGLIVEGWEYWHPRPTYLRLRGSNSLKVATSSLPVVIFPIRKRVSRRPRSFRLRGEFLKDFRARRAWTQLDAARALGVAERVLRKAEAGEPLSIRSIAKIALGCTAAGQRVSPEQLLADSRQLEFLPPTLFDLGCRVQQWFDAQWNEPDFETLKELAAPHFCFYSEVGVIRGVKELVTRIKEFNKSFTGYEMRAEHVCDLGNAVAVRWSCSMTHSGRWLDLPATGRRITIRGSSWAQLVGDKFGDAWDFWDPATVYEQLVKPAN